MVKTLSAQQRTLIIVDDGSGEDFLAIFKECENYSSVSVLHHNKNIGKGQALKTGFDYFLKQFPLACTGVITADADGQHLPKDIEKISQQLLTYPHHLWLGTRTFNKKVPWRSRFGNELTRRIFRLLVGQSLRDTQTGLRAIPRTFLPALLALPARGYAFELDMLICAAKQNIPIKEITIETVYVNKNQSSHFNPLVDSLKIYLVFLRFLAFWAKQLVRTPTA